MLGNFHVFLSAEFLFKLNFIKIIIRKYCHSIKQFGSRSRKIWARSGSNCLQRLSADNTSIQRVNFIFVLLFIQIVVIAFISIEIRYTCLFYLDK